MSDTSLVAAIAITVAGYLVLFAGAEALRRFIRMPGATTRRVAHVGGGLLALVLPVLFDSPLPVWGLAIGFVVLMWTTRLLGLLGSIHDVGRRTWGAETFPIGIAAAFALSGGEAPAFPAAIAALALGDAAADMLGSRIGRYRYRTFGDWRSAEGSLAMLVVTSVSASVIGIAAGAAPLDSLGFGLSVAIVASATESLSPRGTDNLTVPVAVVLVGEMLADPLVGAVLLLACVACLAFLSWTGIARATRLARRAAPAVIELGPDDG
jgi:dolichol kinase